MRYADTESPGLNPTLWRTCRVLANELRLNILRHLLKERRDRVQNVAEHFNISESVASQYLRDMNARGLLKARKSFRYVYYTPEPNATIPETKLLLRSLKKIIQNESQSNATIMNSLTGFTHPRRLKIVQALNYKPLTFIELKKHTGISPAALSRHLAKLLDRYIVEQVEIEKHLLYKLEANPSDPLISTLIQITLNTQTP